MQCLQLQIFFYLKADVASCFGKLIPRSFPGTRAPSRVRNNQPLCLVTFPRRENKQYSLSFPSFQRGKVQLFCDGSHLRYNKSLCIFPIKNAAAWLIKKPTENTTYPSFEFLWRLLVLCPLLLHLFQLGLQALKLLLQSKINITQKIF